MVMRFEHVSDATIGPDIQPLRTGRLAFMTGTAGLPAQQRVYAHRHLPLPPLEHMPVRDEFIASRFWLRRELRVGMIATWPSGEALPERT
jgi:hypothetical protein